MRLWAEGYVQGHAGRLQWDVDFLITNYSFVSCLNVGGAPFLFEYLISRSRPDVRLVSLDLNPLRFPRAAEILGTEVVEMDIEQANATSVAPLGQFQCLVFCEIFEHLRIDVLRTMKLLGQLMAPEGILYLTMPNGLGLSAWLTKFAQGRTGPDPVSEWRKLSQIGHMGHVREYSLREIQGVLEECGLRLDRYFFRRQSSFRGTSRSRIRDTAQVVATNLIPSLGDEIVVVAPSGFPLGSAVSA
jgi:SAM-dependent methyltransferase